MGYESVGLMVHKMALDTRERKTSLLGSFLTLINILRVGETIKYLSFVQHEN